MIIIIIIIITVIVIMITITIIIIITIIIKKNIKKHNKNDKILSFKYYNDNFFLYSQNKILR